MSKIIACETLEPQYKYATEEIVAVADKEWLSKGEPQVRRAALKIFNGSGIKTRSSAVPLDLVFKNLSFEEKNNIYIKEMIHMGEKVLRKALDKAQMAPKDIDVLITTSCTGFMIPSVDAYLVNLLGMKQDIIRLPVTEMGCAGGTSALIYADNFLKGNPNLKVAVVSVEIPSITFQLNDFSMENIVSTAIFADGASCVIFGESKECRPTIKATKMYHFPDADKLMGYHLTNTGLKIILDREVPAAIDSHFNNILYPFLEENHVTAEEIHHYLFHPGGKKIINRVDSIVSAMGKDISESKAILFERGNMSSSTILYILEKFMKKNISENELGYMLAFGPGFMAQSLLLEWK